MRDPRRFRATVGRALAVAIATLIGLFSLAPLAPMAAQEVASIGDNLVANGDFESATGTAAAGWMGGESSGDRPYRGNRCLHVSDADSRASIAAISAPMAVRAGQMLELKMAVRTAREGQTVLLSLQQYRADGRWISGHNIDSPITGHTRWQMVRLLLGGADITDKTANVRLALRPVEWSDAGELVGEAWFDDAALRPITLAQAPVPGEFLWQSPITDDGTAPTVRVWSAANTEKIPRNATGPAPANAASSAEPKPLAKPLEWFAVRGEIEAAQLVVSAGAKGLHGVRVEVSTAVAPLAIEVREVAFVTVTRPTRSSQAPPGDYPDPLPLHESPVDMPANSAQPFWISARIPREAAPGDYVGELTVRAAGDVFGEAGEIRVPFRITVNAAVLPGTTTLRTAYGFWRGHVARYHHLAGDDLARAVELYFADFAAHRIAPIQALDDGPIVVRSNWNWGAAAVADPLAADNRVLKIVDDRDDSAANVAAENLIPIDRTRAYRVAWRVRTEGVHDYLVSVNQHDAAGQWISGHNRDLTRRGTGEWAGESAVIRPEMWAPNTAFVRIRLFARGWTPAGEKTGTTFFDDIAFAPADADSDGPATENLLVNGNLELATDGIEISVDFTAFDREAEKYLDGDTGFNAFNLRIPGMGWGSYNGHGLGRLFHFEEGTPEYEAAMESLISKIAAHLESRGWLDRAYVYWFDEPHRADYDFVRQGMARIGRAAPKLKRLLTEQIEPELAGAVDIWVPVLHNFNLARARNRQAAGDEIWWYVCTVPKPPYPGNFIDEPGMHHRGRFWLAWRNGVEGSLYWQTNYWTDDGTFTDRENPQDPWADPQSYWTENSRHGTWGNGDGRLLYPPRNWRDGTPRVCGPVPSIRWELLRDGIEDYELFAELRRTKIAIADRFAGRSDDAVSAWLAHAETLLIVPESLAPDDWHVSNDSAAFAAHRRQLADCLAEGFAIAQAAADGE